MSQPVEQLDSRIEVVTPENIAYLFRVAGPFRRALAYAVDVAIICMIFFAGLVALIFASVIPGFGGYLGLPIFFAWFALSWFYGGVFETFWNGQTPGKRMLSLRVISIDGQPIDAMQAILRNILRAADLLPSLAIPPWAQESGLHCPTFIVGLLAMMCSQRFQRLGDLVCGTMVVLDERQWMTGVARVTEPAAIQLAGMIPANFRASRSLGRALSSYIERRARFSWARRAEIVRHLGEPLRVAFQLPPNTNLDMLLCAVYYHTFVLDQTGAKNATAAKARYLPAGGSSPFAGGPPSFSPLNRSSTGNTPPASKPVDNRPIWTDQNFELGRRS